MNVGTLWKNTSKQGKKYYSGEISLGINGSVKVVGFPKTSKNGNTFLELVLSNDNYEKTEPDKETETNKNE